MKPTGNLCGGWYREERLIKNQFPRRSFLPAHQSSFMSPFVITVWLGHPSPSFCCGKQLGNIVGSRRGDLHLHTSALNSLVGHSTCLQSQFGTAYKRTLHSRPAWATRCDPTSNKGSKTTTQRTFYLGWDGLSGSPTHGHIPTCTQTAKKAESAASRKMRGVKHGNPNFQPNNK